jgi:hypothetical protein
MTMHRAAHVGLIPLALLLVPWAAVAQPQIGPSELARAKAVLDLYKAELSAQQYALLGSKLAQTQQAYGELSTLTEASAGAATAAAEGAGAAEAAMTGGRAALGGVIEALPLLLLVLPATAEAPGMKEEKPQVRAARAKLDASAKELAQAVRQVEKELQAQSSRDPDAHVDLTTPPARDHILDGDGPGKGGGHRPGTGKPGKSEFPASWTDAKIIHEISDVATDPKSRRAPGFGGRVIVEGSRDGVGIRVIVDADGKIITGFPTNQPRNP